MRARRAGANHVPRAAARAAAAVAAAARLARARAAAAGGASAAARAVHKGVLRGGERPAGKVLLLPRRHAEADDALLRQLQQQGGGHVLGVTTARVGTSSPCGLWDLSPYGSSAGQCGRGPNLCSRVLCFSKPKRSC